MSRLVIDRGRPPAADAAPATQCWVGLKMEDFEHLGFEQSQRKARQAWFKTHGKAQAAKFGIYGCGKCRWGPAGCAGCRT